MRIAVYHKMNVRGYVRAEAIDALTIMNGVDEEGVPAAYVFALVNGSEQPICISHPCENDDMAKDVMEALSMELFGE